MESETSGLRRYVLTNHPAYVVEGPDIPGLRWVLRDDSDNGYVAEIDGVRFETLGVSGAFKLKSSLRGKW